MQDAITNYRKKGVVKGFLKGEQKGNTFRAKRKLL